MKMHDDELDLDVSFVQHLLADQFPELTALPIRRIRSTGTVNAIFRLGDELYARLPRVATWAAGLENEWQWIPKLAPGVSLQLPEPVGKGEPTTEYPHTWAIFRWIDGHPYSDHLVTDEVRAAQDLATFITELRRIDPAGAPPAGRRPLLELDADIREKIAASGELIDGPATLAVWEQSQAAPVWTGSPVWIHADLLPPNILVRDGRIRAVIDFGSVGIGDPAADLIAAWSVFGPAGRAAFREQLQVDDGTWLRARGFALVQVAAIPYYRDSNPDFVTLAQRTVEQVLLDAGP